MCGQGVVSVRLIHCEIANLDRLREAGWILARLYFWKHRKKGT